MSTQSLVGEQNPARWTWRPHFTNQDKAAALTTLALVVFVVAAAFNAAERGFWCHSKKCDNFEYLSGRRNILQWTQFGLCVTGVLVTLASCCFSTNCCGKYPEKLDNTRDVNSFEPISNVDP